ncbi:hypothetical protein B0H21DRAFT_527501 [Amylocystis lapponica]|nr:hypothetical protein B0H21DRAFT_527501 [Amylocystis lapponica]
MRTHNVEVSIACDGKALKEYNQVQSHDTLKTCYIESVEGKRFQCRFRNHLRNMNVAVQTIMDGNIAGSILVPPDGSWVNLRGQYISSSEVRPFKFARVTLADYEPDFGPDTTHVGLLEFRVWRIRHARAITGPSNVSHVNGDLRLTEGPMPEKSKKDGFHQVALGQRALVPPSDTLAASKSGELLDEASNPYVVFRFCYRPKALLDDMQASATIPLNSVTRASQRLASQNASQYQSAQAGPSESQSASIAPVKIEDHKPVKVEDSSFRPIKAEPEDVKLEDGGSLIHNGAPSSPSHRQHDGRLLPDEEPEVDHIERELRAAETRVAALQRQLEMAKRKALEKTDGLESSRPSKRLKTKSEPAEIDLSLR